VNGLGSGRREFEDALPSTTQEDIRNAQAWIDQLNAWIDAHSLRGFDPFDVKQHPLIRAVQTHRLLRKASSVTCDMFPNASRRVLRIQPTENPKAFALVAMGRLRLYQATGAMHHLDVALECLRWLREHAAPGASGLTWGYPFNVRGTGLDTPTNTPTVVVAAIAGEAYALAHRLTKDTEHLEACRSIANFLVNDIPRLPENDGSYCFAYTPADRRRVHNANLHGAAHLMRVYQLTGERALLDAAEPAIRFTVERQRQDGSWPYGEYMSSEPFEPALLGLVDHYHTGFVLRSLLEIQQIQPGNIAQSIERGFAYYRRFLFDSDGAPVNATARYPIDIHACAEGILCPSVLSSLYPEALDLATRTLNWTAANMRDTRSGAVYYRKYPFFTSRVICTRWGIAWIYRALCEYAYRASSDQEHGAARRDVIGAD